MAKYIVLVVALFVVFMPGVIWRIYRIQGRIQAIKDVTSKPFVCHNCGHRFYVKPGRFIFLTENSAYLKCPNCGKRDVCGRPYDQK